MVTILAFIVLGGGTALAAYVDRDFFRHGTRC
jgi:hypothetical protein